MLSEESDLLYTSEWESGVYYTELEDKVAC